MRQILLAGLLIAAGAAHAETRAYGHFGVGIGGDRLATIRLEDGLQDDLRAGTGFALNLGIVHHFDRLPFSLQAGAGYFARITSARNSRARFSRYPLEVLAFWNNGQHRFGGGVVHHMSPTLDLDNLGGAVNFDAATGVALEYGYKYFSVRYTDIEYSAGDAEADGRSVGVYFSLGY